MHNKIRQGLSGLALAAVPWMFVGEAHAQIDNNNTDQRLMVCSAIANVRDRLACYESVAESIKAGDETDIEDIQSEVPDVVMETAPPPAVKRVPAMPPATESRSAPVADERADLPVVPEAVAPRARAPQSRDTGNGDLTGTSVVARVWENHDGRFTVKLDNGQYWRETEGTRVGIPEVGQAVKVTRSLFGSYRMKIDGIPRTAWVRPTD